MKTSRRNFLQYGVGLTAATALPTIWRRPLRSGYRSEEVAERLRRGEEVSKHDLPTPSLILDMDIFEENIRKMARHAESEAIDLRPHAKTHKCVQVARKQVEAGALGVCTATIAEAEALAAGGIGGLLITSEMVGREKIGRLIALTRSHPETMSVVDHPDHADRLSEAAVASGLTLNIMIDVDPIGRRTGIQPGEDAKRLARHVAGLPGMSLKGIHSYSGASSHTHGFEERKAHSWRVMEGPLQTFHDLKREGLPMEIFSGGSTGTYNIDPEMDGFTELQVGSYVFMDVDYRIIGGKNGPDYDDFGESLKVIATVISRNHEDRATVDGGFKAFATDRRFGPDIVGIEGVEYRFGGDEHGIILLEDPSREVKLGDRIEFIVPHCDPNVNLYSQIHCVRGDRVEEIWPIVGKHV